jgi:hypothetical protein
MNYRYTIDNTNTNNNNNNKYINFNDNINHFIPRYNNNNNFNEQIKCKLCFSKIFKFHKFCSKCGCYLMKKCPTCKSESNFNTDCFCNRCGNTYEIDNNTATLTTNTTPIPTKIPITNDKKQEKDKDFVMITQVAFFFLYLTQLLDGQLVGLLLKWL